MADRPGRPRVDPAYPSVQIHLKLPQAMYDEAYRLARSEGISVPELVRNTIDAEALIARTPGLTPRQAFRLVRDSQAAKRAERRASQLANMSVLRARRERRLREGFVEDVKRYVVYARHKGICGICKKPVDQDRFHLDHIIPLAKGGQHSYANTQPAH